MKPVSTDRDPVGHLDRALEHLAATRRSLGKQAGTEIISAEEELEQLRDKIAPRESSLEKELCRCSRDIISWECHIHGA